MPAGKPGPGLLCLLLVLAAAMQQFGSWPAQGAPVKYAQALADFQNRQYAKALAGFQSASRASPGDSVCHYYMALCYQYLNQIALSSQEYQWVATNCRDPRLQAQARSGLAQMDKYKSARLVQMNTVAAVPKGGSGAAQQKTVSPYARGKMKVIEFTTTWCHVCKSFAPVMSEATSKFSRDCQFEHYDAEEPRNSALVKKYAVRGYPTTVFADSTGTQISKYAGGTDIETFSRMIQEALEKLPK